MDLDTLRTVLLITLPIIVVYLAARRFKEWVRQRELPAVLHAEVLSLQVRYHPARLRVEIKVPNTQTILSRLLTPTHDPVHAWETQALPPGRHVIELDLPALADGEHVLEVSTPTQRTLRSFRLRST